MALRVVICGLVFISAAAVIITGCQDGHSCSTVLTQSGRHVVYTLLHTQFVSLSQ